MERSSAESKDQEGNDHKFLQNFPLFAGADRTQPRNPQLIQMVPRFGIEPRVFQTKERALTALHCGGSTGAGQQVSMLQPGN
jgi:hypothetical protein